MVLNRAETSTPPWPGAFVLKTTFLKPGGQELSLGGATGEDLGAAEVDVIAGAGAAAGVDFTAGAGAAAAPGVHIENHWLTTVQVEPGSQVVEPADTMSHCFVCLMEANTAHT